MQRIVRAALPPVAGSPGIVQGNYGDAGNLELAVPDADDGVWVLWWNADPVEHHSGAARGCWSGGLHVFAGHRVDAARISQVEAGPNFLELLALSEQTLHRLYWTPDRGFVEAGPIAPDVAAVSTLRESPDELQIEVLGTDGVGRLLVGDKLQYPFISWVARESAAPAVTPPAPNGFPDIAHDALASCESSVDGGRTEVVLRVGSELLHVHGSGGTWGEPELIESRVWADSEDAVVHRR